MSVFDEGFKAGVRAGYGRTNVDDERNPYPLTSDWVTFEKREEWTKGWNKGYKAGHRRKLIEEALL